MFLKWANVEAWDVGNKFIAHMQREHLPLKDLFIYARISSFIIIYNSIEERIKVSFFHIVRQIRYAVFTSIYTSYNSSERTRKS